MKIAVIAGSPKGELSVTRQYVGHLETALGEHSWTVMQVASRIKKIEREPQAFEEIIEQIRGADVVLWAFPVYVLLVPAGLKRFVELIRERGAESAFSGKLAASLSTSIHFHDNCAHDYIRAISEDLGMSFIASHSPEMHDLLKPEGRRALLAFARHLLECAESGIKVQRRSPPLPSHTWRYEPGPPAPAVDLAGRRLVVLHDADRDHRNVLHMVDRLRSSVLGSVEVFNLRELDIKGSCIGCLRCGSEGRCAYEGKDELIEFYERVLKKADILVFAGTVVDRHLSARWRQFFDRSFYNNHRPSFPGRQLAFLISGPLSHLANLQEVLDGYAQFQEMNLVDILSDEGGDSALLDQQLGALARRLVSAASAGYIRPLDFQGVGGRKIFRDMIFGRLRMVFPLDHRYYQRTGFYDFPTRNWGMRLLNVLLGSVLRIRWVRRQFDRRLKEGMVRPLRVWSLNASR